MNYDKVKTINIFDKIRDIPYKLRLTSKEEDDSCDGKHQKLADSLRKLGYEIRWRRGLFKWNALPIPQAIKELPHNDYWVHSYLEIKINNEWKVLDITWDNGLRKVLSVNDWDGLSDTKIAVPIETMLDENEINPQPQNIEKNLNKEGAFRKALNQWFEKTRKNS